MILNKYTASSSLYSAHNCKLIPYVYYLESTAMERNPDSTNAHPELPHTSTDTNHPVSTANMPETQQDHAQPRTPQYRPQSQRTTRITIITLCVVLALIAAVVGWSVYANKIKPALSPNETTLSNNSSNTDANGNQQNANPLLDTSNDQCDTQLQVVASVNQWGSLAQSIGGKCATVTSIIASTSVEPHDYEPTPADLAKLQQADIVILNGAGYDPWATKAQLDSTRQHIITVSSLVGIDQNNDTTSNTTDSDGESTSSDAQNDEHTSEHTHAHTHTHTHTHAHTDSNGNSINPHLWFDLEAVDQAAHAIEHTYAQVAEAHHSSSTSATITKRFQQWDSQYDVLTKHVAQLKAQNASKKLSFISTESIIDDILTDLGITNITPESYTNAMNNDAEPSPSDLQHALDLLKSKQATMLIVNPQELNNYAQRLQRAAQQANIPIIEVSEQLPENQSDLLTWLSTIVNQIEQASKTS